MVDDRIYTVYPYRVGKPPVSNKRGKFWIILAVIVLYVVLVGIIVLVVLLSPKKEKIEVANIRNRTTTQKPFRPSPHDLFNPAILWDIDPRSTIGSQDRDQEIQNRTRHDGKFPKGWEEWLQKSPLFKQYNHNNKNENAN